MYMYVSWEGGVCVCLCGCDCVGVGVIIWAWNGVCGCDSLDCSCKVCVRRGEEGEGVCGCGCDSMGEEGCVGGTALIAASKYVHVCVGGGGSVCVCGSV